MPGAVCPSAQLEEQGARGARRAQGALVRVCGGRGGGPAQRALARQRAAARRAPRGPVRARAQPYPKPMHESLSKMRSRRKSSGCSAAAGLAARAGQLALQGMGMDAVIHATHLVSVCCMRCMAFGGPVLFGGHACAGLEADDRAGAPQALPAARRLAGAGHGPRQPRHLAVPLPRARARGCPPAAIPAAALHSTCGSRMSAPVRHGRACCARESGGCALGCAVLPVLTARQAGVEV